MDERQLQIIDAAIRVISRYGIRRTTMGDVADEAGVARQTLYNCYEGKEDLIRATIRHCSELSLQGISEDIGKTESLPEQLDAFFLHHAVEPYEMVHASPEAEDIILGVNELAEEELNASYARHRELALQLLAPYANRIRAAKLTPEDLSDFVQTATVSAKKSATSRRHLDRLLATLKTLVLRLVDAD